MKLSGFLLSSSLALVGGSAARLAVEAAPAPRMLARWLGGELDEDRFRRLYDLDGKALAQGGAGLEAAVCKAVYREIYQARARADGLDRDPTVVAELGAWRQARLAQLYQSRHFQHEVSEDEVRAVYRRDLATAYLTPATVSLDVLFVRCGTSPAERQLCRARMEEHSRRLAAGEPLAALAAVEEETSGKANGHFEKVSVNRLDPALARLAGTLATGEVSAPVETFSGWYRIRVAARVEAAPAPFEAVAPAVRQQAEQEALERWQAGELARLSPANPSAELEAVLAAAAAAEGLALTAEFLAEEAEKRSWLLADAAFLRHAEVLPSDERLALELAGQQRRFRRFRLVVATLPAAGELAEVLASVDQVKKALAASPVPARRLTGLAGEIVGLEAETVGPATVAELGERSPRLAALLDGLEAGGWRGPEPVSWRQLPAARPPSRPAGAAPQPSLLFVAVDDVALPPLAEVRHELLQAERGKLGEGVEIFLSRLQPVWKIELLVP